MKVLLTTDTYFPMINGVVTSINYLYKELKALGHDVKIMTLSHGSNERIDGDIYYLKSVKVGIYPDARIRMPFSGNLTKKIMEWKPDLIHSQTEFSTMIAAKFIAKKLNIPHLHTYHTMYEDYLKYIFKGRLISKNTAARLTKILLNSLDGVVAPTKKVEDVLLRYGIKVNTFIVPTGIDLSRFKQRISFEEKNSILSKYGIQKDEKVVVYVGRIAEEKNLSEIISYYAKIKNEIYNIKLLIVGGGPYLETLQAEVRELQLDGCIHFTGMVSPLEVYKYYQLGDAFITASTSESQGLTYIEALASGCPVICHWDRCVDGLIINGVNGFTYHNFEEFSSALQELYKGDTHKELVEGANLKVEEYSCATFGKKISLIYERLYNERKEYQLVV